jgi:putative peptidoglycan lipid II flippase
MAPDRDTSALPPPIDGEEVIAETELLARQSLSAAKWTVLSRVTGFVRAAVVAAVLGATYLGNIFQETNYLPNIVFESLTGSLLATLLVPELVRHIDRRDPSQTQRVANGFLGVALGGFFLLTVAMIAAGPLVVGLLSLQAAGHGVGAAQQRVGVILLALLMPQVLFYAVAGVGGAVMNAHGRFALAAAAPAFENIGVMVTMAATAVVYGTGRSVQSVGSRETILRGAGTTAAVGLHAAAQWWGARRLGVRLFPRAGWRDPKIRALLRRTAGSLGFAGLTGLRQIVPIIVANGVPGGVVALYLGLNFYWLPTKVGARPVFLAQLPRLARLNQIGAFGSFRDELVRGAVRGSFITVPAAVAYLGLAGPLAGAVSFGHFAGAGGVRLLTVALMGLSLGLLGESAFLLITQAAYAREDVRSPFAGMAVRTGISAAGMLGVALFAAGDTVVLGLGLALTVGDLLGAVYLTRRVARDLPSGRERLLPGLLRAGGASLLMVGPAYGVAVGVSDLIGRGPNHQVAIVCGALVGAAIYLGVQRAWGSPELDFFVAGLRGRRRSGGRQRTD